MDINNNVAVPKMAFWFIVSFMLFKLFYVPFELAFNAQLVDVASAGSSLEEIHGLEFYGRTISSLAIALAFFRLGLGWLQKNGLTVPKLTGSLIIVCLLGVLSFFGQKAFISSVVKQSTGEQRRVALLLNFLPAAIRYTHVEGFNFDSYNSPEAKTFLAETGALLFFSSSTYHFIEDQLDHFIEGDLIRQTLKDEDNTPWRGYIQVRSEVKDTYDKYAQFRRLATAQDMTREGADRHLSQLVAEAGKAWQAGNDQLKAATSTDSLEKMNRFIGYYFYHESHTQAQSSYHQKMVELFGTDVDESYWCSNMQCPVDKEFIPDRIKKLVAKRIVEETGMDPLQPFSVSSATTANFIRKAADQSGITLPKTWTAADRETFVRASLNGMKDHVRADIDPEIEQLLGGALWQDLKFPQFESLPKVQEKIRNAMERHIDISDHKGKISMLWDRKAFEQLIVKPQIAKEARAIKADKVGLPDSYDEHGSRAKIGQDAVKRIIIPPISLTLSSFFAIFNVVSLLTLVAEQCNWLSKRFCGWTLGLAFLAIIK
ncbi:hypothetical protein [Methylomicrobium sp. Wu6]|uniref:hypothetical protein n=1 Tax=Methylomicrobium sp. Wu6 TaxID=3107928 RepID=UPI002DD6AA07|nr:hypothetical protein [Methylomicrobium sp. Wu6]MEC4749046.1 hypothetical protein [Methylomicrobium sp. Wu6]